MSLAVFIVEVGSSRDRSVYVFYLFVFLVFVRKGVIFS